MAYVVSTNDFDIPFDMMEWIRDTFGDETFNAPNLEQTYHIKYGGHLDLEDFFAKNPGHPVIVSAVKCNPVEHLRVMYTPMQEISEMTLELAQSLLAANGVNHTWITKVAPLSVPVAEIAEVCGNPFWTDEVMAHKKVRWYYAWMKHSSPSLATSVKITRIMQKTDGVYNNLLFWIENEGMQWRFNP